MKLKLCCCFLFVLSACTSDNKEPTHEPISSDIAEESSNTQSGLPIPNNQVVDDYQILLMGNSHVNSLAGIISHLISARFPAKQVTASSAQGIGYLSDRIKDKASMDKLTNTPWTHVILQAQKYSTSGGFTYPTDAAVSWIKLAKAQNSTPIMFPEHPRLNNTTEGLRVYQLHKGIAEQEAACVAPVGLAWDRAIALDPDINLHHVDGNHANTTGKLLTAFVFYQVITGESADALPYIEEIDVDELTQNILRQIASYALEQNPACDY